jgi:hypothetical protein
VTEADILLRKGANRARTHAPEHVPRLVHTLDKPPDSWAGASGYVSPELIKAHVPPAELGDKIKWSYAVRYPFVLFLSALFAVVIWRSLTRKSCGMDK